MKRIAILQSNYIPWKGYFDLIASVDEFIIFDDVQYTRRDWRNRNLIKTPQGLNWLTVPVNYANRSSQSIRQTEVNGSAWAQDHWQAFTHNYKRSPFSSEVLSLLMPIYKRTNFTSISELNIDLIRLVNNYLNIKTKISFVWDYTAANGKTNRLIDLCKQANATEYVSGPSAKNYIDTELFESAGINLSWFNYNGYPEYPQLWGNFLHGGLPLV